MEDVKKAGEQFRSLSYEELDKRRLQAFQCNDLETLREIEEEARRRDGYDDTDARYNYLANQCRVDIKTLMAPFGHEIYG